MKQVILNADDFGLTRGVNEGIIRGHREGILTSATLMANGPAFDDAIERAKANPKLAIGCHLVLSGGVAVAPREKIPSLAGTDGSLPESLAAFVVRVTSGSLRTEDIETELRAQIEKIRAAGVEPSHVDTHKHTHTHPRVMNVVARVARASGISRIRNPVEDLRDSWRSTRPDGLARILDLAAAFAVHSVGSQFRTVSRRYGLLSPDHFLGLAATGRLNPAALARLLAAVPEGRTEIMLHPGLWDPELEKVGSRLQHQRQIELEALLSPEVGRVVQEHNIRLITYRDLN
ncbi:MAG TPA: ChbG/HpnK family deacetylase [Candidatus Acidoferrales bacterium]|nr:ChbG/HpnK family deacetylase [Candidatus Acidoferrales bacterium]